MGRRVEVRVHARFTEVVYGGQIVAVHERLQGQQGIRVQLDHYLELLREKPGALKGSLALHQAREAGGWPGEYDRLWAILIDRYGEAYKDGLKIELVDAGQTLFAEDLRRVFSTMATVSEAQKNPELELYHAIALRVVGDEPRFRSFLKRCSEVMD